MLITPAATSTGTDSRTMRRSTVRCVRQPATRHTRHNDGAEDREHRRDPVHLDERGREEQARQRHRVGGRGHDRRGDVVEVPVVARR